MKNLTLLIFCFLLIIGVAVGYVATLPTIPAVVTITYEVRVNGNLQSTKIRTQESNGNFAEEITYHGATPADDLVQNLVGIVGEGVFSVDHQKGELTKESQLPSSTPPSASFLQASPAFQSNSTILGYDVIVMSGSGSGITTSFAPALNANLRYDIGDGVVQTATEVKTTNAPVIILPKYDIVSYDPFKIHINNLETANRITPAEATALRNTIPEEFRNTPIPESCGN